MTYKIEIRNIEPVRVAYLAYQGDIRKASKVFPTVFKSIKGSVNGAPFFHYLEMNPITKIANMELCVPTDEIPSNPAIHIKEFPTMKALCTTHIGPYDTLVNAYEAINSYAMKNNIQLDSQFREVYVKGAGMIFKGNPKMYITDIAILIVESK